jgi:hypothetical protein
MDIFPGSYIKQIIELNNFPNNVCTLRVNDNAPDEVLTKLFGFLYGISI